MDAITRDICERALDTWGCYAQSLMVLEESSELTHAPLKWIRRGDFEHIPDAVVEESADVNLMLNQLILMHGLEKRMPYVSAHPIDAPVNKVIENTIGLLYFLGINVATDIAEIGGFEYRDYCDSQDSLAIRVVRLTEHIDFLVQPRREDYLRLRDHKISRLEQRLEGKTSNEQRTSDVI